MIVRTARTRLASVKTALHITHPVSSALWHIHPSPTSSLPPNHHLHHPSLCKFLPTAKHSSTTADEQHHCRGAENLNTTLNSDEQAGGRRFFRGWVSGSAGLFVLCGSLGALVRSASDEERREYTPLLVSTPQTLVGKRFPSCSTVDCSASEAVVQRSADGVKAGGLPEGLAEELRRIVGPEHVTLDLDERESHGTPWNTYHKIEGRPDAVVYPQSTEDVAAVVKRCAEHKVPVVAYGGGTSLEGHILTPRGGVSLDLSGMRRVRELHVADMDATVEAGLGWVELNEELRPHGLFFPLDPGPGASIGGMCSTRCSGSLAVRYGTMRDNVIAMRVVLANGDIVKTAARSRKTSAGYDLTRLMIGSEGTLGIITEVTVRLQKIPEAAAAAMCTFPTVRDAAQCSIDTMHSGVQVSRVEMLDDVMMRGINLATGSDHELLPTLLFEFVGSPAHVHEQAERVQAIAAKNSGSNFIYAPTDEERVALWRKRKEALWSAASLRPGAEAMVTDVCVPLSRLADCVDATKRQLEASSLPCPFVAHAGDGNFHVIILFDPDNPADVAEAHRINSDLVHRAIAMDGTCTGEHGVGIGKIAYLEEELGPEAVRMMGTIKRALDPDNIMNPGKILRNPFCS